MEALKCHDKEFRINVCRQFKKNTQPHKTVISNDLCYVVVSWDDSTQSIF